MARNETTLAEVLQRVVARLISQVADATSSTCYISLDPDSLPVGNPGEFVYVVTPAPSGSFDESYQVGGGQDQCSVAWPIVVTIHSTVAQDEEGRDAQFLNDSTLGIVVKTTAVFKAMVVHDLQDGSTNEILNQMIHVSDAAVDRNRSKRVGSMQLGFGVEFDWNLS